MHKLWPFFLMVAPLSAAEQVKPSLPSLYHSLDPLSILQNLAFYELYPDSHEGKQALERAWSLLCEGGPISSSTLILPKIDLQAIISLVTKQPSEASIELSDNQLQILRRIGSNLPHRLLKGADAWTEEDLLSLKPEEVDLGRALLIYQFEGEHRQKQILQYEASLDLMAMQIKARLPVEATDEEKIRTINAFIFHEMGFRFPPHSLYAKDVDLYTFLPAVLDSRRGVCLGVSILYLCLAQRLHLPLEIITPPGHIYLRYPLKEGHLNIETTARGIHLPSDTYLGVNTRSLQQRNIKEVIGMSFMNQAAVFLERKDYQTAIHLYEKARLYLPDHPLLQMLLGITYLFEGEKKKGKQLLAPLHPLTFEDAVSVETIPSDYLKGRVDIEGIEEVYQSVDENRTSIIEKQALLQKTLKKHPRFRAGIFQLAISYLQIGRNKEALEALQKYHAIDPLDATVEYYLSILYFERFDYVNAWHHFKQAEKLTAARNHDPKALKQLKLALKRACPDPFLSNG